jgi:cytochrome b561
MQVVARYTRVAVILHWLVAVLIIGNVVVGLAADSLPEGMIRPAVDLHKSIGLTVLGLAVMRVLWRLSHRPPPWPRRYPWPERLGAHAAHLLLYGLILGLPISGWVHDSAFKDAAAHPLTIFGLPWFRIGAIMDLPAAQKEQVHATWFAVHVWMGYALYALLALHVLGALKHQFWDREPEFARMSLGGAGEPTPGPALK